MKKGQLSVEHLVIVGLSLMVIIPGAFLLLKFAESTNDQVYSEQIRAIGSTIVFNGRDVYLKGSGNLVSVTLIMPDVVSNISISNGDELIVNYRTLQGTSQAVFFLDYPVVGPNGNSNEVLADRAGILNVVINSTDSNEVQLSLR
jgi:hypothetical protein